MVIFFTIFELDLWSWDVGIKFTLCNCLIGGVKLTKNADPNKLSYSGYGIGFDTHLENVFPDSNIGKSFALFWADMCSLVHIHNE